MRLRTAAAALLAVLMAAPLASAAVNQPLGYHARYGYLAGLDSDRFTMASGALLASVPAVPKGSMGFFSSQGTQVTGLTRVCWTDTIRQCADSPGAALSVRVGAGGSFGLQFPTGADATLSADHALALFADLSTSSDLNGLKLGKSVVAPLVGGRITLNSIAAIPASTLADPTSQDGGAVAALDPSTVIEVLDGSAQRASLRGKLDPVTFAGSPQLTQVRADLVVLPFVTAGASAHFTKADAASARAGLDINRINALLIALYNANAGQPTQAQPLDDKAFGPYKEAASALFGGAVVDLATAGNSSAVAKGLTFARTTSLRVQGLPSGGLAWDGKATVQLANGHVPGGPKLYGWSFVALPWFGWFLWVLGLTAWITRMALHMPKKNERWDRLGWIGWIAGPLAFLLVMFWWDGEAKALFGISALHGGSTQVALLMLALEAATFAAVSFAVIAPLRLLLRNGSMLLGQGTFMGLAGPVATLLGFLLGATLLRSELDLLVSTVVASIS